MKNQLLSTKSSVHEGNIEEAFDFDHLSYETVGTWLIRGSLRTFNGFSPAERTLITKLHAIW
jgi:hypothetical protein